MERTIYMQLEKTKVKPLLRWAGGKTWLIERINEFLPKSFINYHEPFIGGAAIFLNISFQGNTFISDYNSELICFYNQVKTNPEGLIDRIRKFKNSKENFYKIREMKPTSELSIAARFYYLNRTCFNGLYRVNMAGLFNVPYGHRDLQVLDLDGIRLLSKRFQNAIISCNDFEISMSKVNKGDFVFLDPPYTVAHNKNGFIQYNQKIFSWADQERLAVCVRILEEKGAFFIMTNACHDSIKNLYKGVGKQFEIERYSTISAQISSRSKISELIITNCI